MAVPKIQTGLRIEEQTYGKLRAIADQDGRSLNNLIEHIIRLYLRSYEEEHGEIHPYLDE